MKRNDYFFALLIVGLASFALILLISTCDKVSGAEFALEPNGKTLYEKNCRSCHGIDGKGNPKMAKSFGLAKLDLTDEETVKKSDDDLIKVIRDGAGKMKGYKEKLKDEEIKAIFVHVRILQK